MIDVGFYSLPVVGLTTLFSGMVIALQSYTGAARVTEDAALAQVSSVVVLAITRELAPVLAGLMVAGRIDAPSNHQSSQDRCQFPCDRENNY